MNQDNRLWKLIARKLSGEATQEDIKELEALLGENASDQYLYEILQAYWMQHSGAEPNQDKEMEEGFKRIMVAGENTTIEYETSPTMRPHRMGGWKKWIWSASAAAVLVLGFWLFNTGTKNVSAPAKETSVQHSEVMAKKGTRSKIILPDGTQVWLNADSRITYLNTFNNELREVELDGEAFFDVVKDAKHPFVVHTSGIDIKVLGTAFNVKSYQQDPTIETTLLRGLIEVTKRDDTKTPKVILHPHEKLVFDKKEEELSMEDRIARRQNVSTEKIQDARMTVIPVISKPDSAMVETSWVYNKLVFEGENFKDVAAKMERWYNVKISFRDEKLMRVRFKGTFENETIRQALTALKLIAKFDYVIKGNEVEIVDK